jgi:hypothetical protein
VLGIPCIDSSDPREVEMVRRGITHKGVRRIILQAIDGQAGAWVSHTFDEVFVGGRWRRLNYGKLGQNILDEQYLGLMTHTATFSDWADGEMAKTWGVRQAREGPHDDVFGGPNPYSAISVSDRFGVHANVANDLLLGPDELRCLTIERAYWWSSPERKIEMDLHGDDPAGHVLLHVKEGKPGAGSKAYRAFWSGCSKEFLLRAAGQADVRARATRGFWADPEKGIQEFHLAIEPGELAKMEADVPYSLAVVQPEGKDEDFRWEFAGDVTLARHPGVPVDRERPGNRDRPADRDRKRAPAAGEKSLFLDRALWSDDLPPGNGLGFGKDQHALLVHVGDKKAFAEVKAFTAQADLAFALEDGGRTVVSTSTGVGGVTMGGETFLLFQIGPDEWRRLEAGTSYELRPRNQRPGWRWRVDEGLRVARR